MADIIAQLQVLQHETGCLLDLTAILDLSVCPNIDIKTHRPHTVEEKDDCIYVTPTEDYTKRSLESETTSLERRCGDGKCYQVPDAVCKRPTVALDLELIVVLGLLTQDQLNDYMCTLGMIPEHGHQGSDGYDRGDNDDCGVDPLLSAKIGNDGDILDLEVAGEDGLLSLNIGGKDGLKIELLGPDGLLSISKRDTDGLVDVDVGGEKDEKNALVDVDVLTHSKGHNHGNGNGYNGHSGHLSHYQPVCGKGFKKHVRDHAEHCHATDVNHCLAICHQKSALLTLDAHAKVGDIADILLCAAIEFDQSADHDGHNCHYMVAPETEPCHDGQLEHNDHCHTFVRN